MRKRHTALHRWDEGGMDEWRNEDLALVKFPSLARLHNRRSDIEKSGQAKVRQFNVSVVIKEYILGLWNKERYGQLQIWKIEKLKNWKWKRHLSIYDTWHKNRIDRIRCPLSFIDVASTNHFESKTNKTMMEEAPSDHDTQYCASVNDRGPVLFRRRRPEPASPTAGPPSEDMWKNHLPVTHRNTCDLTSPR